MQTNMRPTSEESEPTLDVSSLIDVCFLLLIYFLVTSTITPAERDLAMKLPVPGQTPSGALLVEPLLIEIGAAGDIHAGDRHSRQSMDADMSIRDLPLLQQYLGIFSSASRAANTQPLVRIEAHDDVPHQRVIDVLNALAAKEIHAVTFTDLVP